MYITLSNISNGEFIPLNPVIDNQNGDLEVALNEILYYPAWVNISASKNNMFHYDGAEVLIPDGYYDVCTLNELIFAPIKLKLAFNLATGLVTVSNIRKNFDLGTVGPTLGFVNLAPDVVGGTCTAETLPKLIVHKEVFIHLEGLSTKDNRHNQFPSTLLRAVHVKSEGSNCGRTESFSVRQYKRLSTGSLSYIRLSVLDNSNTPIKLASLSCVLHVKHG